MVAWAAFGDEWAASPKVNFDGNAKVISVDSTLAALDIKTDVYDAWLLWKDLYSYSTYPLAIRKIQDFYFLQNGWSFDPGTLHVTGVTGYLLPGEVVAAVKGDGGLAAWNVQPGTVPLF